MEEMFAEVVAMAAAGRMSRRGLPRNPLDLAVLARRYDQEAHAPLMSVGVQRALLAPLVMWARHPRRAQLTTALVAPPGSDWWRDHANQMTRPFRDHSSATAGLARSPR